MSLAPVLICTHTRIFHLKSVVESLKKSRWAHETILYISSDAARTNAEEEKVEEIRNYVDSIIGFRQLVHIKREKNLGHFDNFQESTKEVFKVHNKIIKLEDDVVVGYFFLDYMNYYLDLFEKDKNVVSISSNIWPGLDIGRQCASLIPLSNGWGWGTWRDKFNLIDHSNTLAIEFIKDRNLFWKMNFFNPSLLGMVNAVAKGRLIAGDVNWALHLIKYNKFVLFPPFPISGNIGFDGTGQNCHLSEDDLYARYFNDSFELSKNVGSISADEKKAIFRYFGGHKALAKQLILYYVEVVFGYNFVKFIVRLKAKIRENLSFKYFFF